MDEVLIRELLLFVGVLIFVVGMWIAIRPFLRDE